MQRRSWYSFSVFVSVLITLPHPTQDEGFFLDRFLTASEKKDKVSIIFWGRLLYKQPRRIGSCSR